MSLARFDDVELYYEVHGRGQPLVLIHGASGTHLAWWQQVAALRHRFTCLIYDVRGFGKSVAKNYDPGDGDALVRDLERLISHVGFDGQKVDVLGNSLGTAPALGFAFDHPERIGKLILSSGIGGLRSTMLDAGWKKRVENFDAGALAPLDESTLVPEAGPLPQSAEERMRFAFTFRPFGPLGASLPRSNPALAFLYAEIAVMSGGPPIKQLHSAFREGRPVTEAQAAKLTFPVLMCGGSNDTIFPPHDIEAAARLFPNGKCKIFKDAGHAIYFEQPKEFNETVEHFLLS